MKISFGSLKHIFSRKKGMRDKIANPLRAWKVILLCCVLLTTALAALAGYLFLKIERGEIFKAQKAAGESVEKVNTKLLEQVLSHFDERKARIDAINQGASQFADPSR